MYESPDYLCDDDYCDDCDNFYGYYGTYEDYRVSIMYYEEDLGYNYPIIQTIDEESENIHHFKYLSEVNKTDFDSLDLNRAYVLINEVVDDLKNE